MALKRQTDTLTEKLTALRGLNVFSLQEQQNIREVLTAGLIDLQFFPDLQCEHTQDHQQTERGPSGPDKPCRTAARKD